MRFQFRHIFEAPRPQVEAIMLSKNYVSQLLQNHATLLEAELQEWHDEPLELRRSIRYLPKPVIEAVGPKKIPPAWFAFVETSIWDKRNHELRFENVPTSATVRKYLVNRGTIKLHELGSNRTERVAEGELKLNLPFLLKPLAAISERLIHTEAEKILNGEAHVLATVLTSEIG